MKSRIMTLLALGLVCVLQQAAQAESADGECPIKAAMNNLPQLEYQVGTTLTTCSKSAAKLSEKDGKAIQYFVAKKEYENKAAATLALAEQTETLVKQFATATKCDKSGTISVGGKKLECSEKSCCDRKVDQRSDRGCASIVQGWRQRMQLPERSKEIVSGLERRHCLCCRRETDDLPNSIATECRSRDVSSGC